MKHYIDRKTNQLFAFEADGSQDDLISENLEALTDQEADAIRNPQLSPLEAMQQAAEQVRIALQAEIDKKAKSIGFSSGNALMLYAGFTNGFKAIAVKFATWEASVWIAADAYKEQVVAGTSPMLTPDQAIALMPTYPA